MMLDVRSNSDGQESSSCAVAHSTANPLVHMPVFADAILSSWTAGGTAGKDRGRE